MKVDKGGGCESKKADEEDGETEEVGGLVGRAGHQGRHDSGGRAHGQSGGIIKRYHGGTHDDTEPYKHELIYLTAKGPTSNAARRGATFIHVHNRKS